MNIKIQGKPLKEWVEEQKKKDGVMIVHRGTTRNGYSTSTYNGAIVTVQDDKDIRYENADISLRINGKEYRLTGNLVERKSGIWYVDGSIVDLPEQEQSRDMADGIKEVERNVTDALAQPLGPTSAPGCDEPTSRCQTSPSIWTLGRDQPVIPRVAFIR